MHTLHATRAPSPLTTDVLVVGGGIVGLSTALFLRRAGLDVHLVERHPGTSIHPRAWGWYARTLEIFRAAGVLDDVLAAAEPYRAHTLNARVTSLAGRTMSCTVVPHWNDLDDVTPCPQISLGQDELEPIIRRAAEEAGATLWFNHQAGIPVDHGDHVVTRVTDRLTGRLTDVTARWVVAADGARSPIREALGITRTGRPLMRSQVSILFRAELGELLGERRFSICQIENDEVMGVLGHRADLTGGTLILTRNDQHGADLDDYSHERAAQLVRSALGVPDHPVEIVDVLGWDMAALVADRFVSGRVVLAGDACHVVPPIGGYGANTGVQDAFNLAWRLVAEVRGDAGPELIVDYERERRQMAQLVAEQGRTRLAVRGGFADDADRARLKDPLWVTLGQAYGVADDRAFADPRTRHAEVGTRFPHTWIEPGLSTLDLIKGWTLFAPAVPLAGYAPMLPASVRAVAVPWPQRPWWTEQCDAGMQEAILVRPDGVVAARGELTSTGAALTVGAWLVSALQGSAYALV